MGQIREHRNEFILRILASEPLAVDRDALARDLGHEYDFADWEEVMDGAAAPGRLRMARTAPRVAETGFWPEMVRNSHQIFPEAEDVVANHAECLTLRMTPEDDSAAARVEAARRLTVIAALIARMGPALAVVVPSADRILSPGDWQMAANDVAAGLVPVGQWMTLVLTPFADGRSPAPVTVSSHGLRAFTGSEIVLPRVRMARFLAVEAVSGAAAMLMAGHAFRNGEIFHAVIGAGRLDIHHCPAGRNGAETDQWWLVHDSAEVAMGPVVDPLPLTAARRVDIAVQKHA